MSAKKQKIEIEMVDGKPSVTKDMINCCLGKFGVWAEDEDGNRTDYAFIDAHLLTEIYQTMALSSIGNAGKVVTANQDNPLPAQKTKDIRIVFSVPGNVGLKEWVVRNQEQPKTMESIDVLRNIIRSYTLHKDIVIVAWEALDRQT